MSDLNDLGERDSWRCWLCDAAVDPEASVNSDLGPSVDSFADSKGQKGNGDYSAPGSSRLQHHEGQESPGRSLVPRSLCG